MQKSPATASVASPHLPLPYIIIAAVALIASLAMVIPGDPEWWKVVVLGIVQGITEWLPISSTGHLLIVSKLLNYQGSIGGTFEIFIQVGTVVAVVAFYIQDLLKQAQALLGRRTSEEARAAWTLWLGIAIAMVPAGIVGLLARDFIKAVLFETPQVIAGAL
ncbi:MAG: undecaprenyl-diphosphatase, partial [Chloroflexia bacterium]|nr:undecaprenyl-diphosphatase [Chloroflexia bacterium]